MKKRFKGIYFCKYKKKWIAKIQINGKTKYLGVFDEKEEASRAYREIADQIEALKVKRDGVNYPNICPWDWVRFMGRKCPHCKRKFQDYMEDEKPLERDNDLPCMNEVKVNREWGD